MKRNVQNFTILHFHVATNNLYTFWDRQIEYLLYAALVQDWRRRWRWQYNNVNIVQFQMIPFFETSLLYRNFIYFFQKM